MNRRDFLASAGLAAGALWAGCRAPFLRPAGDDADVRQREIDLVTAETYEAYLAGRLAPDAYPALMRVERAFDRVLSEAKATTVRTGAAVWYVYNMGIVVKTRRTCLAVDLLHRRAPEFAPLVDAALVTHNHDDHYTLAWYRAVKGAGKAFVADFMEKVPRMFRIGDVEIRTSPSDHGEHRPDFTTAFEMSVDGFTIYHTGDSSNVAKLTPSRRPDLWFVHPICGLDPLDGCRAFDPKTVVLVHLNELGHDTWRWSWDDGFAIRDKIEAHGGRARVPFWGERLA